MQKEFNITGWCHPKRHYMADISGKIEDVLQMVYQGKYFIINRPRQFGKTTILRTINQTLSQSTEWLVFSISFEQIGSEEYSKASDFCISFLHLLYKQMVEKEEPVLAGFIEKEKSIVTSLTILSDFITRLVHKTNKKLILLIDEVDKSSNNQLFLDFLGILRSKFLERDLKTEQTFHSIILTGVHDIKTLKISANTESKLNSPWNIATDFRVAMELQVAEIIPMLEEYASNEQIAVNVREVAEQLFYYTSGYPFLVSHLCKIIVEEVLPDKAEKTVGSAEVTHATELLIQRTNSNFDSLKKNLANYPKLYQLAYNVAVNSAHFPFNVHQPTIELGVIYGVFGKSPKGQLQIHNRIYREIIYDFMSLPLLEEVDLDNYLYQPSYTLLENRLNMEKVVLRFQDLLKEQYSKKDRDFVERQGRLLFLAYLKPILNGSGFSFKEPQISEEKRIDIAITFFQYQYVVELKIWRGKKAHEEGLIQLANYLEKQSLDKGYLVIFDQRVKKSWDKTWIKVGSKRIFAVWV